MDSLIAALLEPSRDIFTHDVRGKRVLVRADLNLPQHDDGSISDSTRLDSALPTVRALSERGARVILASHLGRPEPGVEPEEEMRRRDSLRPVAALLKGHLGEAFVGMADDIVGPSAQATVAALQDGQARHQKYFPARPQRNRLQHLSGA